MNSTAASAASAAYQTHRQRNNARLQPVQEHPWEQSQSYFDQLRKPASPDASRSPPWPSSRQNLYKTRPSAPTPTQRLDSLLDGSRSVQGVPNPALELLHGNPNDSRQLMVVSQRERRNNTSRNGHGQELVRRKPTQQQLRVSNRRQGQYNPPQASQLYPFGPPISLPRCHVPQDLIEGARVLRQAGISLPNQGERALATRPEPQIRESSSCRSGSMILACSHNVPLESYELPDQPRNVNPIPEDLLESMGRLRLHETTQPKAVKNVGALMTLPEMPDSTAADVAGSNYELLAVADEIAEDRMPHSRIGLVGLAGSGKTRCLYSFITLVRNRAPSKPILEIDVSVAEAIRLRHDLLPGEHTCNSLEDVTIMLQDLDKWPAPWAMVVIEGLNRPRDADIVQIWCQRVFDPNCCVIVSTRRLDVAKSFITGHRSMLYIIETLSHWTVTYILSSVEANSAKRELIAKQLSYHPSAVAGAEKLMSKTGMRADELTAYLSLLGSDPSRKNNPSFKMALEAASGSVSLVKGQNGSHFDRDASALFTILVHCVQPSWLDVFTEIDRIRPSPMALLGVLAALGHDEIEWKLIGKIQRVIDSIDAIRILQAHCLITTDVLGEEQVYRCPFPVLMAVQMWLAGQGSGALEGAFKLADAVAQVERNE